MCINRLKNQQSNFIDLAFFKHMHKFRSQCLKVFKQARSQILNIGHNGKYFQMILRSIIGNEIVFVLNHYSDTMCVVFLSGCEPVDILVGWLYRYCCWRSNYKSWVGCNLPVYPRNMFILAQSQGWNFNAICRGLFVVCSI